MLTEGIPFLQTQGEVFISDALKRIRVRCTKGKCGYFSFRGYAGAYHDGGKYAQGRAFGDLK